MPLFLNSELYDGKRYKSFSVTGKYHLDRTNTAASELTHLPLFHMVHASTQACRRAILTAGEMAVQWKNTAMFW